MRLLLKTKCCMQSEISNGNQNLSSMEQLDELDRNWREIKSMNEKKQNFAHVASNNRIYEMRG